MAVDDFSGGVGEALTLGNASCGNTFPYAYEELRHCAKGATPSLEVFIRIFIRIFFKKYHALI